MIDIPKDISKEMFHVMKRNCEKIIEQIEEDKITFTNPWKLGFEMDLQGNRKYQMVLELKEVEE